MKSVSTYIKSEIKLETHFTCAESLLESLSTHLSEQIQKTTEIRMSKPQYHGIFSRHLEAYFMSRLKFSS